ncbi:uncharacterized protein PFL1_05951 [Pseudozyma flocculosa PF-1]|uniref:Uncharacterized protein n=2 Tax=Pseudozyma flocculosa TaxID=84751 RepID=A0A5C3F1H9_9BASI|nr:uncharacterized protein PFL1_05951 [Pseudozyma flocculosa PF-1]EPQ26630.1 hypothetical protein PFL1_05951 [Pseudozyma flocculosa PF-1]SPO38374.1 uncharacterized protein PSFLO_03851 [Pseudozyma flocculosa]
MFAYTPNAETQAALDAAAHAASAYPNTARPSVEEMKQQLRRPDLDKVLLASDRGPSSLRAHLDFEGVLPFENAGSRPAPDLYLFDRASGERRLAPPWPRKRVSMPFPGAHILFDAAFCTILTDLVRQARRLRGRGRHALPRVEVLPSKGAAPDADELRTMWGEPDRIIKIAWPTHTTFVPVVVKLPQVCTEQCAMSIYSQLGKPVPFWRPTSKDVVQEDIRVLTLDVQRMIVTSRQDRAIIQTPFWTAFVEVDWNHGQCAVLEVLQVGMGTDKAEETLLYRLLALIFDSKRSKPKDPTERRMQSIMLWQQLLRDGEA